MRADIVRNSPLENGWSRIKAVKHDAHIVGEPEIQKLEKVAGK